MKKNMKEIKVIAEEFLLSNKLVYFVPPLKGKWTNWQYNIFYRRYLREYEACIMKTYPLVEFILDLETILPKEYDFKRVINSSHERVLVGILLFLVILQELRRRLMSKSRHSTITQTN